MFKQCILYFKHQKSYLLFLLGLFVLPLGLFLQFSSYELPKVQYVFLGALFISQYVFYNEKSFRQKIEKSVTEILKKEYGRIPSRKEIIHRSSKIVQFRGFSIIITTMMILTLMVYFKEF